MKGLAKLAPGRGHVALADRPEPELRAGHVILDVLAAGICGTDLHIADDEFRSSPPVTMGHELCGVVAAVGKGVDEDWLGARVVSETYFSTCGGCEPCRRGRINLCLERRSIGSGADGAFAPRVLVPARGLHRLPEALSAEAGVLVEPLACVCNCLLDPPAVGAGDRVLVVGPGPVGLLAAQVAAACGGRVVVRGAGRDAARLELARFLRLTTSSDPDVLDDLFDTVVECSGSEGGITFGLEHARRGGQYVQVGLAGRPVTVPLDELCYRELTVTSGNASTPESWRRALALLEAGAVRLDPLVSEVVPLRDWERAFATVRAGAGVKVVLDPR